MKTLQKGFTLIELMIVVADHRILRSGAPRYQDYRSARDVRSHSRHERLPYRHHRSVQSGRPAPGPNNWRLRDIDRFAETKYVKGISTGANGEVTATVQNISSVVNTASSR